MFATVVMVISFGMAEPYPRQAARSLRRRSRGETHIVDVPVRRPTHRHRGDSGGRRGRDQVIIGFQYASLFPAFGLPLDPG
jgi:hypothetical protein